MILDSLRLPPGVGIQALNRLGGLPWRWYYVDATEYCRRVRSPIVLLALKLGWRPSRRLPRATANRATIRS